MDRGDDPDQEVEANLVAHLQARLERLGPDPRDARLTVGFVANV